MNGAEILVQFKGDTKNLDQATKSASTSTKNFASSLTKGLATAGKAAAIGMAATATAAVAVGKACWDGANSVAQYGDEIDKTSQKVGMSAKAYQQWDYVMQISGTSMQDCTVGLKTMTNKIDDALNGSKQATEQFSRLGISVDDLKGKSREDIFGMVVKSLQNVEDSTTKAALANDMFGKSGQNLIPLFNTSNEDTQKLMEQTEKYGMVMSDDAVKSSAAFQDSLTKLRKTTGGLKNKLVGSLLPGLTDVMDGFSDLATGVEGADTKIQTGISKVIDNITTIIPKVVEGLMSAMPTLIEAAGKILMSLVQGVIQALPQIIPAAMEVMKTFIQGLLQYLPQLLEAAMEIILELATGIAEATPQIIPEVVNIIITLVETLIDNIDLLLDAAIQLIIGLTEGILNSLPILIEKAPEIIWKLTLALIKAVPKLLKAAVEIIATLVTGLADNLFKLINWCLELPGKIVQAIRDGIQQIKNVGGECMSGLVDGLKDKWEKLKGGVQNLGNGIVNKFKSIFGIHSPSKEFAFIGKMNMEGLNKGMEDMQPEIQKTIDGAFNLNPSLTNNASTHYSPTLNVVVNNDMAFDPLGQLVSNIKTFSGGAKNDYNYGVGR